ncbi:MAG: AAA family ATPase [Anaplasmataceae bacterium]|nr:AAA family ATPase [Anaplasmataceae bacterium]
MSKIFSIVNQKGGVGKTTTSVNISTALAISGKKTLLIDLDPQGNATTGFGVEDKFRKNTIYEVLVNKSNIKSTLLEQKIENLYLIPVNVNLYAAEIELIEVKKREFILKEKLKEFNDFFDYIIIDCPPSLGLLTLNSLVASHSIIIPLQCEFYALEGLSHLLKTISMIKKHLNKNLFISGILLTMYDKRNKLSELVKNDVLNYLPNMVFDTIIPRNVRLSEAPSHGKPAIIYDHDCSGARAYIKLAKEIMEKVEKKEIINT